MKKSPLDFVDDHCCFACGMQNPDGLRIHWKVEGLTMIGEYTPEKKYQGWKGILHGGIIATLLDEAMTRLAWITYQGTLTAEMNVRFVAPAKIGQLLIIRGEITHIRRKLVEMKATIHAPTNASDSSSGDASLVLIAHSTGKAIREPSLKDQ